MKLPAVLGAGKDRVEDVVVPASVLVCCTRPMFAVGTVNVTLLLSTPLIFTTTGPVAAPAGTGATIWVSFQLVVLATTPLNEMKLVLVPTVGPKFVPVIVTDVPMGPDVGFRLVMLGGGVTVKGTLLLACPPTVTTTFPVVAPEGTGTVMLVSLQAVGVPAVPLNVTVLDP